MQQQGGRVYPQGPRETSYLDFSETRPPLFVKAEDPLEVDEWIRVIEQKFGLLRSTETQKPLFAAQQLRGPASTWWGNYVVSSMLVIKLPRTNLSWHFGSTTFQKECSI